MVNTMHNAQVSRTGSQYTTVSGVDLKRTGFRVATWAQYDMVLYILN